MPGAAHQGAKLALVLPRVSLSHAYATFGPPCAALLAASMALQAPVFAQDKPPETHGESPGTAGTLIGSVGGGRHTAETAVRAPEVPGAFLSLAMPGAGQLYAGDPVKAAVYLGAAVLVGAGTYNLLRAGVSDFEAREARTQAFMGLIAYGTSFAVGIASTLDAVADISGRYAAAEEALVPLPGAGSRPRPATLRRKADD